jgi:protein-S-isoprenylcysteine O-methyltransferase Ste14
VDARGRPLRAALAFLVGAAIFVLVPLAAWGAGDLRGFLADPARLAYCAAALLLDAVAAARLPEVGKERRPAERTVGQRLAVALLQVVPLAIVAAAPFGDRRGIGVLPDVPALRAAGVGLYAGGFLLVHWAEAHLGRLFSVQVELQPDHRLVTDGPFRMVRHPRYLGIVLFLAGIALVFRSWLGLALVAPVIGILRWRIADEEQLLADAFGAEWVAYARRTPGLLPRPW